MKWLVKIERDEEGLITARTPVMRTDSKHRPRGGEYEFYEGPETKYPEAFFADPAWEVREATTTAEKLKDTLNQDVYAQMATVFGTSNSDSATAYHQTWKDMVARPAAYSGAGLTARFDRGGLLAGDALDTDQKVTDYATACVAEVDAYAVWRMSRIETYKQDLSAL